VASQTQKMGDRLITIDRREIQEHPDITDLIGLPFVVDTLDAGDFAFLDRNSEPVGIERSEIGNLIQKVRSGELEAQMLKCQDNYASIILLVEGVYDSIDGLLAVYNGGNRGYFRTYVYPRTYYETVIAMEVRLSEMGIELIHSPTLQCTMSTIRTIYNQRTKPEEQHALFKRTRAVVIPTKLTNNPAVPMLMTLCPRLSEKVAIRLINKYDNIWTIIHQPDEQLLQIEGFGRGLLDKLKKGVGKDVET